MSTVSVCVTTFNRATLLDKTLASLAAQVRLPDEVIVSDDCSSDETAAVAEKWRSAFSAFVYRRNTVNLYMPGNLNACVSAASGDYIANLHDADVFDSTLLQKWEAALDQHRSAGFVFCGVSVDNPVDSRASDPHAYRLNRSTLIHGDGRQAVYLHDVEPMNSGPEFFERHLLHATYSIVWGTVMARREAYKELLPFDSQFGFISDVDMWMRMCLHFDIAYVREALIHLDNSSTAERKFDWNRTEATRRIQLLNIGRFYGKSPLRLKRELIRHKWLFRRLYARRIIALAARRQLRMAATGIRLLLQQQESGS
jgi:glycosyltransferase involved in cell wall biosynthesis